MTTLEQRLSRLPREMTPEQDLWPAIEARIGAPSGRWSLPRVAAAAAVFFMAAVALRLGSENPAPDGFDGNLQVLSASAELEYSGALRDLRDSIGQLDGDAQNGLLNDYQQSLRVVHDATRQVRAALAQDPDSRLLNGMLADLQKKQLSVLRDIALTQSSEEGSTS